MYRIIRHSKAGPFMLLLGLILFVILAGCSSSKIETRLDEIESRLDKLEQRATESSQARKESLGEQAAAKPPSKPPTPAVELIENGVYEIPYAATKYGDIVLRILSVEVSDTATKFIFEAENISDDLIIMPNYNGLYGNSLSYMVDSKGKRYEASGGSVPYQSGKVSGRLFGHEKTQVWVTFPRLDKDAGTFYLQYGETERIKDIKLRRKE